MTGRLTAPGDSTSPTAPSRSRGLAPSPSTRYEDNGWVTLANVAVVKSKAAFIGPMLLLRIIGY
jgi:hypothetical protein